MKHSDPSFSIWDSWRLRHLLRLAEPLLLAWLAGVPARGMSITLGRHPPVFAPSPGSGPAVCGAASVAAPFWAWLGGLLA
ncbi:MAG: hypothetical protein ACK56I_12595, partial [bacterium]